MRLKLYQKIAIVFCAISAIILLGVFAYLDSVLKDYVYEKIKTAITKEVLLAKLFLEEDFPGYPRFKKISELSISVGEVIDARVSIIDIDGTVIGDSDMDVEGVREMENHLGRPEIQKALIDGLGESRRFSTTIRRDMLYIAATLGRDSPVGFVRAAVPLTDIEIVSGRLKRILVVALMAAFFLSVIASLSAAFFVTRPLKKISSVAMAISGGKYGRKITVETGDEIQDLAKAFNHMSDRIKATVDELTAQRARLEAVFLSMSDGVMVVDRKSNIILINDALKRIFPTAEHTEGKKPLEVVRNIEVQEVTDRLLASSAVLEKREISIHVPEEKIVLMHGTPILREGNAEGAVMVFHDITDIKRLERMRSDFVANVSHELRTPASNIKGFAETLASGALEDRQNASEFVRIIEESAERLVKLIEDLLDLSRIESGKVPLTFKECRMWDIVRKVENEVAEQAASAGVSVRNLVSPDNIAARCDEGLIFQAIFNLVDNAVKYSGKNGNVEVFARVKKDIIEIEVRDNGPGISNQHLDRIFERFYRVDKARSRESGSTGLGLSIVKNIAEAHGGDVRVESSPGKGSSFFMSIPVFGGNA